MRSNRVTNARTENKNVPETEIRLLQVLNVVTLNKEKMQKHKSIFSKYGMS